MAAAYIVSWYILYYVYKRAHARPEYRRNVQVLSSVLGGGGGGRAAIWVVFRLRGLIDVEGHTAVGEIRT